MGAGLAQIGLFMPNPLFNIYLSMNDLGYALDDFKNWKKRVKILFMAGEGGLVFVEDAGNPGLWWLNVHCPNERPSDNTVKFLIVIAFQSGCKVIRSEVKRAGSAKMLEALGFQETGAMLYELRS